MRSIRELRQARNLTQRQVADAVNVTITTVANWERGTFEPRASQLRRLAQLFDVCMEEIETRPDDAKAAG
jgi:transcriptional regulator with XRE-family HTH domain